MCGRPVLQRSACRNGIVPYVYQLNICNFVTWHFLAILSIGIAKVIVLISPKVFHL